MHPFAKALNDDAEAFFAWRWSRWPGQTWRPEMLAEWRRHHPSPVESIDQSMVYDLTWENNPELTLISKNEKVGGLYADLEVKYNGSQGVATSYQTVFDRIMMYRGAPMKAPVSG